MPVIDEILVFKLAQYIHDPFAVAVHKEYSFVWPNPCPAGHLSLAVQVPYPAT